MKQNHKVPGLENLGLEALADQFAAVYKPVRLAELPMYRWLQIVDDVTILAEEVRHGARRQEHARDRAIKVLFRLLEFIGFYLYVCGDPDNTEDTMTAFVAKYLRLPSYTDYFDRTKPKEGPTRWIFVKYPNACAKCGCKPCECVVTPWAFEERRQKPEQFFEFQKRVLGLRKNLPRLWAKREIDYFTLPGLFQFFAEIYRNSYYHLDTWKLAMHLSEEVGEATRELSRLELLHKMNTDKYSLNAAQRRSHIKEQTEAIITEKLDTLADVKTKKKVAIETCRQMNKLLQNLWNQGDIDKRLAGIIAEKFKEEIADVFSWLSALLYQLSDRLGVELDKDSLINLLADNKRGYLKRAQHQLRLQCPQCRNPDCDNNCLVDNVVSAEIYEKIAQL